MARRPLPIRSPIVAVLASFLAVPAGAQTALPLDSVAEGRTPAGEAAEYAVDVSEAGFLTVVVRSTAGEDMRLRVTDDEYQELPDGSADMDIAGDLGAEQFVVALPRPGGYRVLVETYETGSVAFTVGGAFFPTDLVAAPPDPDGKPSGATELPAGGDHADTLDPDEGDYVDWYRVTANAAGTLTVLTRAEEGDLRLDLFVDGSYREPVQSSDQDQGGVFGNESVTVDVEAGQAVHVRVGPSLGRGERVEYRIASGLIPGGRP